MGIPDEAAVYQDLFIWCYVRGVNTTLTNYDLS